MIREETEDETKTMDEEQKKSEKENKKSTWLMWKMAPHQSTL